MEEKELRQAVLDACLYLQKQGLVARTWGNVSARLNDEEFIITPSGLAYEQTKPEDLVIVKIADCSYDENQRKPSSEKRIHAAAYRLCENVNFVVHTHQLYGSAVCADESSIELSDGRFVPCAGYGLPGTKKLSKNVEEVFTKFPNCDIFLMAKHGVLCLGVDKDNALSKAELLEKECKILFDKRVKNFEIPAKMKPYLDDYAQMVPTVEPVDDPEALKMVSEKNAAATLYSINAKPLNPLDAALQNFVYRTKYSKLRNK